MTQYKALTMQQNFTSPRKAATNNEAKSPMIELQPYATQFYVTKQDQGRSKETLRHYRFHIDRFLAWCNEQGYHGNDFFGVAGAEVIEEYLAHLRASGISLFTIHGVFRSLRVFYKWLFKRYSLDDLECPFT